MFKCKFLWSVIGCCKSGWSVMIASWAHDWLSWVGVLGGGLDTAASPRGNYCEDFVSKYCPCARWQCSYFGLFFLFLYSRRKWRHHSSLGQWLHLWQTKRDSTHRSYFSVWFLTRPSQMLKHMGWCNCGFYLILFIPACWLAHTY